MKYTGAILLLICLFIVPTRHVCAQLFEENTSIKYDTNYVKIYKDELTTRIYMSRKYSGFGISDRINDSRIDYRTNDNIIMGIGYTYSFLTINIGFKLPFINGDDDIYGRSKYLDLQGHTYFKDIILDLYLQWQRGFHIHNPEDHDLNWNKGDNFPFRSDMRSNIVGLNIQYLFNSERFSYKASFVQNEIQKKSAGSPIVGVESYWVYAIADSAIIPQGIASTGFLYNIRYNQSDMFSFGFNGGYAYTLVVKQHIYISVSSVFGLAAGFNWLHNTSTSQTYKSGIALGINNTTRASLGYNNKSFYIGVSYLRFSTNTMFNVNGGWQTYSTQNFRLNIVRRFKLKRPIKILRPDTWIF